MNFYEKVYKIVSEIPYGKVATYGQVAAIAGSARAARQVGFALRALNTDEENIPWWRVINREGYLSINHGDGGIEKQIQRDFLEREGIEVNDKMIVDLSKYLWKSLGQE